MKETFITTLRDKNISRGDFRTTTDRLACILAAEAGALLDKSPVSVTTPMEETSGVSLKNNLVLIPILRSGITLLTSFRHYYENAKVGFVGIRRDEVTAVPNLYYHNIPEIADSDDVIVLDPMIATGGTGEEALKILLDSGIKEKKIIFVAVIASQQGFDYIRNSFSKIKMVVAQIDPKLNDKKFIVPGLGDFGDRYFGTE